MLDYKFYELECGLKASENDKKNYPDEICRGLIDTEYSIAIKADHKPTFEEAEKFIKEDLKKFGYDGVYGITPITEEEVHQFFDDSNIDNWKILRKNELYVADCCLYFQTSENTQEEALKKLYEACDSVGIELTVEHSELRNENGDEIKE